MPTVVNEPARCTAETRQKYVSVWETDGTSNVANAVAVEYALSWIQGTTKLWEAMWKQWNILIMKIAEMGDVYPEYAHCDQRKGVTLGLADFHLTACEMLHAFTVRPIFICWILTWISALTTTSSASHINRGR